MPLARGTRLGPYEILAPIGSGGMGEVWRARDTKLARDVALKVLPDHLSDDPKALARFESEAKAVAALSHPHILAIHDFGRIGGVSFIVTELLDGETLRQRLETGALAPRKALELAAQLADALGAAHEKGIVHRDVKPENVVLTRDGRAKLLDFGLARHDGSGRSVDESGMPTVSLRTEPGGVVGTVAYMSPEQSRGLPADCRSDQFSLGVVLYEMLAGRRPFRGDSAAETLAAILGADPDPVEKYAPRTPIPVRAVLERLLAKDPGDRWDSTRDLARELSACRAHVSGPASSTAAAPASTAVERSRVRGSPAVAVLALAAGLAAGFWLGSRTSPRARAGPARPRLVQLTWERGMESEQALSPDGAVYAYVAGPDGQRDIFSRRVGGETATNLTGGVPGNDESPSYSPDGRSIAFRSDREGGGIFVMGATGESPRRIVELGHNPKWSPDGRSIAFATQSTGGKGLNSEIWVVDVATGARRRVYAGSGTVPAWSPNGRRLAFHRLPVSGGTGTGKPALCSIPVSGGSVTVALELEAEHQASPDWSRAGIAFVSAAGGIPNVWRVQVDEATGKALGEPVPIVTAAGSRAPSSTPDGRRLLCCFPRYAWPLDRWTFDPVRGRLEGPPRRIRTDAREMRLRGVSPDGEWLATLFWDLNARRDTLLLRTRTGEARRLTDDDLREDAQVWAPDGSRLYFAFWGLASGGPAGVWSIRPDGSGRALAVPSPDGEEVFPEGASPDGNVLYVGVGKEFRLHAVDLRLPVAERRPVPLPALPDGRPFEVAAVSADGRWLAGGPYDVPFGEPRPLLVFDTERRSFEKLLEPESSRPAAFLPDARRILLFLRTGQLEVLDRVTRSRSPAGSFPPEVFNVALSPDGRSFFTLTAERESDVWMLDFGSPR